MTILQFSWRRCVPGNDTIFAGTDGLLPFGWIVLLTSGSHDGQWKWDLSGLKLDGYNARGQMLGSPREVAAFVEDEDDRLLPLSVGLDLQVEAEIQHYTDRELALPLPVQWRQAAFVEGMPRSEADALLRHQAAIATK